MRDNWQRVRFGDLVKITHGWPFKSGSFTEQRSGKPIVVNVGNFRYEGGFRFESTTVKEYTGDYPKEYELQAGDILLIMTCQTSGGEILGVPGRIPNDGRTYLHNQRLGKVIPKNPDQIDRDYIYYLALSPDFNRELCVSASGTKILHTAPGRIEAFQFDLPPIEEQKAIAKVLSSLDDKIELNRRMNATLEAMARALFKAWFVDFEPVHANLENRPSTSASPEIAKLFPSAFENGIPKGWRVGRYSDLADVSTGKGLKRTQFVDDGEIPVLGANGEIGRTDRYLFDEKLVLGQSRNFGQSESRGR